MWGPAGSWWQEAGLSCGPNWAPSLPSVALTRLWVALEWGGPLGKAQGPSLQLRASWSLRALGAGERERAPRAAPDSALPRTPSANSGSAPRASRPGEVRGHQLARALSPPSPAVKAIWLSRADGRVSLSPGRPGWRRCRLGRRPGCGGPRLEPRGRIPEPQGSPPSSRPVSSNGPRALSQGHQCK